MPELPEVETIKNQLKSKILGQRIIKVEVKLAKMIQGVPVDFFKTKIKQATVISVSRRAKILIIGLFNGYSLLIHLKICGQLIYLDNLNQLENFLKKYTHLIYYFSNGGCLLHNDIRQFGYVKLVKTGDLEKIFSRENYGPEPLDKKFTQEKFIALFKINPSAVGQKIKPLLMDQAFLSGLGNIYAQEACWCAKILPTRRVETLSEKEMKLLYFCLTSILKAAIKARGTSVADYLDAEGKQGDFGQQLKIYGCEKRPCSRCGQKIKKIILAGRGTSYCPYCQK